MYVRNRRYNWGEILRYNILFFSICMFIIGCFFTSFNVLLWATCGMLIHNLCYAIERFSERIIFFAFNCTFFIFLVGRLVVSSITGYEDPWNKNAYGLDFQDDKVLMNIGIILFLSLISLYLGYRSVQRKGLTTNHSKKYSIRMISSVAFVSKTLFYITYIFNILVLIDKAKFTNTNGYMDLYASYTSSYPGIVVKLAEMCPTTLFIYLGTMPTKRKSILPLVLYVVSGGISLLVGQRNNFVLNILIVLVYLALRNFTDKKEKWFGKKEIVSTIVSFPIIILLLNAVSYLRLNDSVNHKSFFDGVSEFFYAQGVSVNLIGYAQTLGNQLPVGANYTFGRLIDFINNNTVTQMLTDIPSYRPQSLESALYGNSFADAVSYIVSPGRYLSGWGYGSSYLAEMFYDFGYSGVIIGSFILGIILSLMVNSFKYSILGVWMTLSMTRLLLYSPRDTTMSFFVSTFSLINILAICFVFVAAIILSGLRSTKKTVVTFNSLSESNAKHM
ncbi:sugar isomerase [Bacillus thuringiensis serovar brasilensis]|uniref:O-antigen polysaccharide polymerase Wzy family protein n=1 Tax=Bacillus cereus group TaxID=86661 RepID=UPI000A38530A|nr:O-antigen polysaccharide polymerase Wzy family protein [Bacillus thuringiensis]MCU5028588.1 O-antigen polysaccharide polymerase Wzy family protein [Bacillus cereus]MRA71916.1 O-antigen polysaccharide polymerase Wzy [Bacillus thuringiensis]MRA91200.1 O-antigen polysaccharide polymerase Wzy [Bacillus thuringiensis]MRC53417.1 O-antigen polysaccharide polymerase Wzy [Bacillus thuringiensis]OTX29666.1 sugar isomerase [Bacillus thuringiensis serovar brasilensis]